MYYIKISNNKKTLEQFGIFEAKLIFRSMDKDSLSIKVFSEETNCDFVQWQDVDLFYGENRIFKGAVFSKSFCRSFDKNYYEILIEGVYINLSWAAYFSEWMDEQKFSTQVSEYPSYKAYDIKSVQLFAKQYTYSSTTTADHDYTIYPFTIGQTIDYIIDYFISKNGNILSKKRNFCDDENLLYEPPMESTKDITCKDALDVCARWAIDLASVIDYSKDVPEINFYRSVSANSIEINLNELSNLTIEPNYSVKPSGVVLKVSFDAISQYYYTIWTLNKRYIYYKSSEDIDENDLRVLNLTYEFDFSGWSSNRDYSDRKAEVLKVDFQGAVDNLWESMNCLEKSGQAIFYNENFICYIGKNLNISGSGEDLFFVKEQEVDLFTSKNTLSLGISRYKNLDDILEQYQYAFTNRELITSSND